MSTVSLDVDLHVLSCCNCGMTFAVPDAWVTDRRRNHDTWYCPNGHGQHFPGKTDAEKANAEAERLRGELAAARQDKKYWYDRTKEERQAKEAVERSRSAIKGQLTRVKRRVVNGVCPCCNRRFADLHRHMETKHPEYGEAAD